MDEHPEVDQQRVYPLPVRGGDGQAFERVGKKYDDTQEEGHD